MKSASELIPVIEASAHRDAEPRRIDPDTVKVVNLLFRELQAIFPAWRQAWPDDDTLQAAKRSWVKAFMSEGIDRIGQVRHGIEQCRTLATAFAPSVGQFMAMSRPAPERLGLPPVEQAYAQAIANAHPGKARVASWSHQAVYHAAVQCGFHALLTLSGEASLQLFERNYQITVRRLIDGLPLRDIPAGLPSRSPGQRTPEVGNRALALLRQSRVKAA